MSMSYGSLYLLSLCFHSHVKEHFVGHQCGAVIFGGIISTYISSTRRQVFDVTHSLTLLISRHLYPICINLSHIQSHKIREIMYE